jgi:hypothetical protein
MRVGLTEELLKQTQATQCSMGADLEERNAANNAERDKKHVVMSSRR